MLLNSGTITPEYTHTLLSFMSFSNLNSLKSGKKFFFLTTFTPPFRCAYVPSELVSWPLPWFWFEIS